MATVRTVKGPVDSAQLGRTLAHEHIITGSGGMIHYPFFNRADAIEWAIEALAQAKRDGIDTIVDVTTVDMGREIELVIEVAESSEVNIIVATGVYRWLPPPLWGFDADGLAELFVREIEDGIEGTGVRAGVVKIAWDEEALDPTLRKLRFEPIARAAARASKRTGVPISCHTLASARLGEPVLDIFAEEGLDMSAAYIGHCNDTDDLNYLLGLAARGAVLGMDRYFPGFPPHWHVRSACAKAVVEAGYGEQVCLSHDHAAYGLWATLPIRDPSTYSWVPTRVLPWLRENGLSDDQIEGIMVRAPRRLFERAAAGKTV
jgi:phosphotriesterase-related protein